LVRDGFATLNDDFATLNNGFVFFNILISAKTLKNYSKSQKIIK